MSVAVFFFQAEDGIRDYKVTGVQTCALPISRLLLILTARSNELHAVAGPSALISDGAIEALPTLELEPLPAQPAERVVAARGAEGEAPIAGVPAARILQAGNGNPLGLALPTK